MIEKINLDQMSLKQKSSLLYTLAEEMLDDRKNAALAYDYLKTHDQVIDEIKATKAKGKKGLKMFFLFIGAVAKPIFGRKKSQEIKRRFHVIAKARGHALRAI